MPELSHADLTIEEIERRLLEIRTAGEDHVDDEVAHSLEDKLRADFIRSIAAGSPPENLRAAARLVLMSDAYYFKRWCA